MTYLDCKALIRQLRKARNTGLDGVFPKGHFDVLFYTVLQKKKEAIESGKQQTENTLKEGNDILDEARRLADEINSVIVVSIL